MAATGLLGINPYYKGTNIDVSKPVNLAIQLEQKERAKQEALDKYLMDYEKTLNPNGMRQQDQNAFLAATSAILDSMINDGPSSYNFSNIGSGNTMLYVSLFDSAVGSWDIDAPLSGTMPDLILPAAIEQKFEQMTQPSLNIQVYGYNTHNPSQYDAFRKKRAETTRSTDKTRSNFFDNYTYQYLNVDINY